MCGGTTILKKRDASWGMQLVCPFLFLHFTAEWLQQSRPVVHVFCSHPRFCPVLYLMSIKARIREWEGHGKREAQASLWECFWVAEEPCGQRVPGQPHARAPTHCWNGFWVMPTSWGVVKGSQGEVAVELLVHRFSFWIVRSPQGRSTDFAFVIVAKSRWSCRGWQVAWDIWNKQLGECSLGTGLDGAHRSCTVSSNSLPLALPFLCCVKLCFL